MSRRMLNWILLLVFLGSALLGWVGARNPSLPNTEFLPNMAHSPAYGAYEANTNFGDGMTLRRPMPGTIARNHMPLHYAPTTQDAERAGRELASPIGPQAFDRGAALFASFCQHCHGSTGQGDGAVARRGFPPPPFLTATRAMSMKDGQMFHVLTYGQGNMPSHAAQLSHEDRWELIAYVRSLQHRAVSSQPAAASQPAPTSQMTGATKP